MQPITIWFVFLFSLAFSVQQSRASIQVLYYTTSPFILPIEIGVLRGAGLTVTGTNDLNDVSAANLSNFDVFYAGSTYGTTLDSKATILRNYVSGGGGIVVGQSNVSGAIDWLPPGLEASIASNFSDPAPRNVTTALGAAHPIFNGIAAGDLSGLADNIDISSLGADWDVLTVGSNASNLVGMASGTWGSGRLLLWQTAFGSPILTQPSNTLTFQAFAWTSGVGPPSSLPPVPEPPASAIWLVLGVVGWACSRRRRSETTEHPSSA